MDASRTRFGPVVRGVCGQATVLASLVAAGVTNSFITGL